ncbi:MAG: hypothetical protein RLN60_00215 [Phycisphaerales bacterium]
MNATALPTASLDQIRANPTPANAARSIASADRRPGTASFRERLEAERALTDPADIAKARARRELEARSKEHAKEFVAQALVYPMLKEARESDLAWGPFKPGKHEKALSWLIDERAAQNIVGAKNFSLVDRVAESLVETSVRLSKVLADREGDESRRPDDRSRTPLEGDAS